MKIIQNPDLDSQDQKFWLSSILSFFKKLKNSGFFLMSCTIFFFTLCGAMEKNLTLTYTSANIIFIRSLCALPILLIIFIKKDVNKFKYKLKFNIIANALGALSLFLSIQSLSKISMMTYGIINSLAPVFICIMAILFLKERATLRTYLAYILCFTGSLIILYPFNNINGNVGVILAILSVLVYSISMLLIKKISDIDNMVIYTVYVLCCLVIGGICSYDHFSFDLKDFWIFLLIMMFHFMASFLLIMAMRRSKLSHLTLLEYTAIIWAALLGFIFWNEMPKLQEMAGGILIILGSLLVEFLDKKNKNVS